SSRAAPASPPARAAARPPHCANLPDPDTPRCSTDRDLQRGEHHVAELARRRRAADVRRRRLLERLVDRGLDRAGERRLDVAVLAAEVGHDLTPEARGLEHVRLVDRDQLAAARPRQLERAPRDALDLGLRVDAGVEDAAVLEPPAAAVVEAADELAHDHEIDALAHRRAQVGVDVELLAEPDQALLGPLR